MRKLLFRLLSASMVIICLLSVTHASLYASQQISECSTKLVISGNTVTAYYKINGTSIMDEIGASKIVIQRYTNSSWVPVKTFTKFNTAGMVDYNTISHTSSVSYTTTQSGTYRAVIELFATLDGETDSRTLIAT